MLWPLRDTMLFRIGWSLTLEEPSEVRFRHMPFKVEGSMRLILIFVKWGDRRGKLFQNI